ncbi:MAG: hypothetical protein ACI9R3_000282 [Verrucomicrobiales bacterium]|jgi:hypothetical protein
MSPPAQYRTFCRDHAVSLFIVATLGTQYLFIWMRAADVVPENFYIFRFLPPLFYALGLSLLCDGFEGIRDLIRPLFRWRVHIGWWIFAVFWLTAFAILLLVVQNLVLGKGFAAIPLNFADVSRLQVLKLIAIVSIIEEIAWIGFAMKRLCKEMTPFMASLVVGAFWCCWWVPVIVYGDGVIPGLPISILFVHYLGIAATCMWVYHFTKSALVVAVMQMFTNIVSLVVPILPHQGGMTIYIIYVIAKCAIAILLFKHFGPRPLFRKQKNEAAVSGGLPA